MVGRSVRAIYTPYVSLSPISGLGRVPLGCYIGTARTSVRCPLISVLGSVLTPLTLIVLSIVPARAVPN